MRDTTPFDHPERIGPYRVVQVIGEGGMGIVYEAEQREPVRRRVAVKMMKVGMDTKDVIGRFEAERQALAVMDHPGVARVFDAGATEQGRPYFVMELVQGIRIDDYCDRQRLTTRQRVELFIDVCRAVQHAHQKGVIHRDLKPGNILVAEVDGVARPKIIDFGVAKATGQRLTQHTVVTTYGQAVGTLAYMSPEQAEMSGLDVDTRIDIYSLGVVLHELLTGRVPLDPGDIGAPVFLAELVRRDQTMPTLTKGVVRLDPQTLETVARLRGTSATMLAKELKGDLEWIVVKAMEKDRDRRYETASGLALDLQRYVDNEPVEARPHTTRYRLGKFVRRNRAGVAFASTLVVALAGFSVSTALQARRVAVERDRAESEAAKAQAVNDFMEGILLSADPLNAFGPTVTLLEAMDSAVAGLAVMAAGNPEVDAAARTAMGNVYFKLGRYAQAATLLEDALRARLELLGEDHLDVAESRFLVSRVLQFRSEYDSAEVMLDRSLAVRRSLLPANDVRIAETLTEIGALLSTVGRHDEAERALLEAWSIQEAADPGGLGASDPLNRLATLHRTMGDLEAAERDFRAALAIRESHLPADHPLVGESLNNLAVVLDDLGRKEEAASAYRRGITIMEATFGGDSDQVSALLSNLALVLTSIGENREAEALYRRALRIDRAALGADHFYVGIDLSNLARHLCMNGPSEEGLEHAQTAAGIFESSLESGHWQIGLVRSGEGLCLGSVGRYEEAERTLLGALELLESALPPDHQHVESARERLIAVYEGWGRPERAEALRR